MFFWQKGKEGKRITDVFPYQGTATVYLFYVFSELGVENICTCGKNACNDFSESK